jgi:penicillin-binding protein 2
LIRVVVGVMFAALVARLVVLQIVTGPGSQVAATANYIRTIYTPAPRGEILDRNGNVLVGNVEVPVVTVNRQVVSHNPAEVASLALLDGEPVSAMQAAINNNQYSPYSPVTVMINPTPEQMLYLQEHPGSFPGVNVSTQPEPYYTKLGDAAANILGYVGQITASEYKVLAPKGYQPDAQIGQTGLEAEYESVLAGKPGVEKVAVDAAGNVVSVISSTPPVPGDNIRLSIDGKVQQAASAALAQEIAIKRTEIDSDGSGKFRATGGAVVVEDPSNGKILAMASYPTFNPSWFVGGISAAHYKALTSPSSGSPLENRAISGQYFPGSTFKLVTATAGLESGVITANSYFDDVGGGITVDGHFFANDAHQSFGEVDLKFALTVSDDAFFYNIGGSLYTNPAKYGVNFFQKVAGEYGFGRYTGVDLPGEGAGYVLTPAEKAKLHAQDPTAYPFGNYYVGDAIESAIGQDDVAVTPLQLANAYSAFANGGTLWTPSLVLDAQTASGKVVADYSPVKLGNSPPLTPLDHQTMVQGYLGVTTNPLGTAYYSFGATNYPIQVGGKTGTAQPVSGIPHTSPLYKQYTSVFTSFAPASAPKYVVDCFISQAGYGASAAAPVVRQVYDVLFHQPILPTPLSGV